MGQILHAAALSLGVLTCFSVMGGQPNAAMAATTPVPHGLAPGQCRTQTVCAPPAPIERAIPRKLEAACVKPRRIAIVRHRRIIHRHVAQPVAPVAPPPRRIVIMTPPCPPQSAERLPADYPSAIHNGYLVWASRSQ